MGSEWKERKLEEICDSVDYGFTASAQTHGHGPKFLRITDIVPGFIKWDQVPFCNIENEKSGKYRLHHGDIVIARTGATTGYSAYINNPPEAIFASYLVRLKIGKEADPRYISYFLKSTTFGEYMRGVLGDKSAQPNASAKTMTQVTVPIPPLPEQRAIAHILGTLDDKIELNRKMNETLEAMARAIFKSWFVDFDPVRAKADLPATTHLAAQVGGLLNGLPKEIADLFPDSFEDSELGEIPKGWEVKQIGDVVRCVGGTTPSTKDPLYWEGGTSPFVTPRDMSNLTSPAILDSERYITQEGVDTISSGLLPAGTLLLSSRAPIGYLAIAEVPVSINQGIIAMICDGKLPNYYMLFWAETYMKIIKSNAGGTTFAEISKKNFRPINIVVPAPKVLGRFVDYVKPLYEKIICNLIESKNLITLRDALLPKLISGEIRVKNAEKIIEEVI
jgi:type I restriction enzyme S subunit